MKIHTFKKGIEKLSLAFPFFVFKPEFYWEYLEPLEDVQFEKAVDEIIKTSLSFPAGMSIVALILDRAKMFGVRKGEATDPRAGMSPEEARLSDEARVKALAEFRKSYAEAKA